jgi:hypothetical protein
MIGTPMLRATGPWKRTSAKGADYFAGRLGGVKIVILENRESGRTESDPTHYLFFAEPTSPTGNSAQRHDGARPTPAPRQSPYSTRRRPVNGSGSALPDGSVADLWAGPVP